MPRAADLIGWRRLRELLSAADEADREFYDQLLGAASQMAERTTRRRLAHHRRTERVVRVGPASVAVLGSFPVTAVHAVHSAATGAALGAWELIDAAAGILWPGYRGGPVEVTYEAGYGQTLRQSIACPGAAALAGRHFHLDTPSTRYLPWFEVAGSGLLPDAGGRQPLRVPVAAGAEAPEVAAALAAVLDGQPDLDATAAGAVVTVRSIQVGAVAAAADVDAGVVVTVSRRGAEVPDDLAVAVAEWVQWEAGRLRSPAGVGVRTLSGPDGLNTALELDTPSSAMSVLGRYTDRPVR